MESDMRFSIKDYRLTQNMQHAAPPEKPYEATGHNSKAVQRAYSKRGRVESFARKNSRNETSRQRLFPLSGSMKNGFRRPGIL